MSTAVIDRETRSRVDTLIDDDDHPQFATAVGAEDDHCHYFVSSTETLCGQRRHPPVKRWHKLGPCPAGHPTCPDCRDAIN